MASFNLREFLTNTRGTPEAITSAFGMPSCVLNLAAKILALLPSSVLQGIRTDALLGKMAAENDIARFTSWIRDRLGVFNPFDENGRLKFRSNFSLFGINLFSKITRILAYGAALRDFGASMYAEYQNLRAEIEAAKRCLNSYKDSLNTRVGSYSNQELASQCVEADLGFIQPSVDFVEAAAGLINRIDAELILRDQDPTREPKFTTDAGIDLSTLLQFTDEVNIIEALTPPPEVFRLEFGPPKAKYGRFLLTSDGMYFDSQSDSAGGLTLAYTEIARKKKEADQFKSLLWKFEHDPNIGGRGKGVALKEIKDYINNVLDVDKIDDSSDLQIYYDEDNFLEQLTAHKNKRIYDLSSLVVQSEIDLYGFSEAEKFNVRQSLLSELAAFSNKEKKRKKQIELAVRFGNGRYTPGNVPLNDFSYLAGTSFFLDIQKQKELTLDQDEVNGIILPVNAKYVVPPKDQIYQNIDHLLVSLIGEANILTSDEYVSGVAPTILRAETEVIKDGLLAIYNFLETNVEESNSSKYLLDNCITNNNNLNARLISTNVSSVFRKGLGIAYLNGIVNFNSGGSVLGFNNHVMLPPKSELEDLFYKKSGVTLDFWIHVPDTTPTNQGTVQQFYKIIFANENTGIRFPQNKQKDITYIRPEDGNNTVKGLLVGFTRDRRITLSEVPSKNDVDNSEDNTCFFVAATQSLDGSTIGFVNKSTTVPNEENNCISTKEPLCFKLDSAKNASLLQQIEQRFCHLAISFNPAKNNISFYLNGELFGTSALNLCFPVSPHKTLNLPTFIIDTASDDDSSFNYTNRFVGNLSKVRFGLPFNSSGRRSDNLYKFTPWVIGGGFTDGILSDGFMGEYGGRRSALDGYIGSFKIYNKALNSDEVVNNYNAQASFFKNINLD